ncbi:MAG: hypothetical protein U0892_05485 [Pirellulales bacterium]
MDLAGAWNILGQAELENQSFSDAMHAFQQSLKNMEMAAVRSEDYRIQSRLGGV